MRAEPVRLVVNADDLGLSEGVTRGILEAHRFGIVTASTLMANMPGAEAAVRLATSAGLDIGLHLNLTAGHPLSPAGRVTSLLGSKGEFARLGVLLLRLTLGRVRREEVEAELVAQIGRARELGATLSHLDSHHHVHAHPAISRRVAAIAAREGIPFVRRPIDRSWPPSFVARTPIDLARAMLLGVGCIAGPRPERALAFRGVVLGTGFEGTRLRQVLSRLPPGVTELMVHPGHEDAELARHTSYVQGREAELRALTDPGTRELLQQCRVELISFAALAADEPRSRTAAPSVR